MKIIIVAALLACVLSVTAGRRYGNDDGYGDGPPRRGWNPRRYHHYHHRRCEGYRGGDYFCEDKMIGCHVSAKDIHGMSKPLAALSRKVVGHDIGPKLVPMLKIVDALIKMKLTKPVIVPLINLSTKTLVAGGTVEKLLGQDVKRALRGPSFRHRQQVTLYCVLTQVANPCLACKLTRTLTLAFNGLLSKIKLLKPVMKLVNKLILMVPGLLKSLKVVTKLVKNYLFRC